MPVRWVSIVALFSKFSTAPRLLWTVLQHRRLKTMVWLHSFQSLNSHFEAHCKCWELIVWLIHLTISRKRRRRFSFNEYASAYWSPDWIWQFFQAFCNRLTLNVHLLLALSHQAEIIRVKPFILGRNVTRMWVETKSCNQGGRKSVFTTPLPFQPRKPCRFMISSAWWLVVIHKMGNENFKNRGWW